MMATRPLLSLSSTSVSEAWAIAVPVSGAAAMGVGRPRTIALCKPLAGGGVVGLVVALDVDGPQAERVAEAQLVAGRLQRRGRRAVRLLGRSPAAAPLTQALEDVEAAGEGGDDGEDRVADGPVVLLVVGHDAVVAQAVAQAVAQTVAAAGRREGNGEFICRCLLTGGGSWGLTGRGALARACM